MTYPESSAVSAGQPTAADHYNNLRLDSLYLGQAATNVIPLGTLLKDYQKNVNLVLLGTTRVRVEATATQTVELMIDGYMLQATANVDLAAGSAPSGGAATWYVFAERSAGSTTFTLNVNTSDTDYADARLIGSFYWDGSAILEPSIKTEEADEIIDIINYAPPQTCQGRLTLTSGTPILSSDVTGGTLYFTPWTGKVIDLYAQNYGWIPYTFTEKTLSASGWTTGKNNDIFAYLSSGAVALARSEWSNDTTRADAVSLQDGRYVMTSAKEYLLLGTVRTSAAGQVTDSLRQRFVNNIYNRVYRLMYRKEAAANWTYNSATIRQANANTDNQIEFVLPFAFDTVTAQYILDTTSGGSSQFAAIGLDRTTAQDAQIYHPMTRGHSQDKAVYSGYPGVGFHYLAMLDYQNGAAVCTYYGNTYSAMMGWLYS